MFMFKMYVCSSVSSLHLEAKTIDTGISIQTEVACAPVTGIYYKCNLIAQIISLLHIFEKVL